MDEDVSSDLFDADRPPNFVRDAEDLIYDGLIDQAAQLLHAEISSMPPDWRPYVESSTTYNCHFWNEDEFLSFSQHKMLEFSESDKMIVWVSSPSYSEAYYFYAFTYSELGDYQNALQAIDQGLVLEPDHPRLLCEKAFILVRSSNPQEALRLYQEAENARSWTPPETIAQALRGQGMALIDLDRLEEAKAALHKSLEYVPDNAVALNELEYIRQLGPEVAVAKTGQKPLEILRKLLGFRPQ